MTKPFTERIWESQQSDGTMISIVKSGVNGLCMLLSALASVVMAVVTPIIVAVDLAYGPLKSLICPEKPPKLPISSKSFYDGEALDSGATFNEVVGWTNDQIEKDSSFLYWMFPQHLEEELMQKPYSDQMVEGFKRMLAFYGLTLQDGLKIKTSDETKVRFEQLDLSSLTKIHDSLKLYGHRDLADALSKRLHKLQGNHPTIELPEQHPDPNSIELDVFA